MNIDARLKGGLAQAVVKAAFSHWQYRVVPFGIEETLREISVLDKDKYKQLSLSPNLRTMPDFIVASADMQSVYLVEVKFRAKWSERNRDLLFKQLQPQAKAWGALLLIIVFREFHNQGACLKCLSLKTDTENNYLKVITTDGPIDWKIVEEKHFQELSEFFPSVATGTSEFKNALKTLVAAEQQLRGDVSASTPIQLEPVQPPEPVSPSPPPIPRPIPPFSLRSKFNPGRTLKPK